MSRMNARRWRWVAMIIAIAVAFALGRSTSPGDRASSTADMPEAASTWTCSMHPQIQLPEPGACPICGMDLIPASGAGEVSADALHLSPAAQKLAEVRTAAVTRQPVTRTLRLVGRLEIDETRQRTISAWVSGRIERLFVDFTGVRVKAGAPLFELYSPELYAAQEELLQAGAFAASDQRSSALATLDAARERLRQFGLTADQITEIETRGAATDRVTIRAPVSGVVVRKDAVEGAYLRAGSPVFAIADLSELWLQLDGYENDLPWLRVGDAVEFSTDSAPGETFDGSVAFVDPVLDRRTRTAKIRVEVPNPGERLKPGVFVRARVRTALESPGDVGPLVVPATAPLITGTRAVVYVEDAREPGHYTGREIVLGPRADAHYVVREGLVEGERVVVNGAFKIDSALQIQAGRSMMSDDPTTATRGASVIPVPMELRDLVDDALAAYFELWQALGTDDFPAATGAAAALATTLPRGPGDLLSGESRDVWNQIRAQVIAHATTVASAPSIGTARAAFDPLSQRMIELVRRFGTSGRQSVRVYHCPMAIDGRGADWLQSEGGTLNPYYGSEMLRCGAESEVLVAIEESAP